MRGLIDEVGSVVHGFDGVLLLMLTRVYIAGFVASNYIMPTTSFRYYYGFMNVMKRPRMFQVFPAAVLKYKTKTPSRR